MNEPTLEEINKVIAEFMGGPYEGDSIYCGSPEEVIDKEIEARIASHYISSLDALVPVWENLRVSQARNIFLIQYNGGFNGYVGKENWTHNWTCGTAQEAAARATYKAIKELEK